MVPLLNWQVSEKWGMSKIGARPISSLRNITLELAINFDNIMHTISYIHHQIKIHISIK